MTSHIFWYPFHIIHFMVIKHKRILCHKVICFLCVVLWRDVCIQKFFYNILICIFITNPWNTYDIVPSIIRRRNFGKVRLGTFSVFLAGKYFLELQHVFAFVTGYYKCMRTHSLNAKNENLFFFSKKSTELGISSSLCMFDTKIQKHFFSQTHFSRQNIKINDSFATNPTFDS